MKSILYGNPVISGIILNISAMFLSICAIKYRITPLILILIPLGTFNRKITDNKTGIDNKKRILILSSYWITMGTLLLYYGYIHSIRIHELINKIVHI